MNDDLTWQQLQNAISQTGAITFANNKIIIDTSLITGDTYTGLNAKGVLEFVYKLLGFCYKAQATINNNTPQGQRLNSLTETIFGAISQVDTVGAKVTATRQISVVVSLDQDNPTGINI